jgi:hypothetical protein
VSRLLASPRRRRRLAWIAALVLAVAAIVGLAVATRHSGGQKHVSSSAGEALNPAAVRTVPLRAIDRLRIRKLVARFVQTAVARHSAASFDLVTRDFRAGATRAQWARGDTPVYPYPAALGSAGAPQVTSSYPGDVLLNVLLQPRKGARVGPILFSMEVKRRGSRWLVDSFAPLEVYSAPSKPAARAPKPVSSPTRNVPRKVDSGFDRGRLSTMWFLLPIAIFALILLLPLALWIRNWRAARRADRAYGARKELPPLPKTRPDASARTTRDL